MVLNPDVVIRSKGVIEKCSLCIQRIQEKKLDAKLENRQLEDGEIVPACAQTCPADAIVFGDLNNKDSKISKFFADERNYHLLEELHTLPSVGYLTKVRNTEAKASLLIWAAPLVVDLLPDGPLKENFSKFAGRKKSISPFLTKQRMKKQAKADYEESLVMEAKYKKIIEDMVSEQNQKSEEVEEKWIEVLEDNTEIKVNPYKKDILIEMFGVGWLPYYVYEEGGSRIEVDAFLIE